MGRRRRQGSSNGHSGQHHSRGALFHGEPFGINPGDDVGNRKSKDARQLPPDDIGNRKEDAPGQHVPPDDVGNRVDAMPTHDLSGVLSDLHGKRAGQSTRPRRARANTPQVRLGRYVLGGVNPLVSLDQFRAQKAQEDENERRQQGGGQRERFERAPDDQSNEEAAPSSRNERFEQNRGDNRGENRSDNRFERNRKHRGEHESGPVDVSTGGERRMQRFFDFEEDDRFEYTLKSTPEEKRAQALASVTEIVNGAGRDARTDGIVIEDGDKPKVVVTIDERGPAASVPAERRSKSAGDALFVLGNPALMSLNYLVNKIVNRYPGDRIRLAIIPHGDLQAYRDALELHRQGRAKAASPVVVDRAPVIELVALEPIVLEPVGLEQSVVDEGEAIVTLPMPSSSRRTLSTPVSHDLSDDAPSADDEALEPPAAKKRATKAAAKSAPKSEPKSEPKPAVRAKKAAASAPSPAAAEPAAPKAKAPAKAPKTSKTVVEEAPAPKKRATRAPVETAILPAIEKVSRLKKSPTKK
jgi:hypothetical protein